MPRGISGRLGSRRRGLALMVAVAGCTIVACGSGGEDAQTSDTSAPPTSEERDARVTFEYDDDEFDDVSSTTDRDRPDRSSTSTSSTRPDRSTTTGVTVTSTQPNQPTQTTTTARPQTTTTRPRTTTTTRPRTTTTVQQLPRCGQDYHVIGLTTAVCSNSSGQPDKSGLPNSGSFTCSWLEAHGMTSVHVLPPWNDPFDLDTDDDDVGCNE